MSSVQLRHFASNTYSLQLEFRRNARSRTGRQAKIMAKYESLLSEAEELLLAEAKERED